MGCGRRRSASAKSVDMVGVKREPVNITGLAASPRIGLGGGDNGLRVEQVASAPEPVRLRGAAAGQTALALTVGLFSRQAYRAAKLWIFKVLAAQQ